MSWSVSASGKPADVKAELDRQFTRSRDVSERETVRCVAATISQCIDTFDPERSVTVYAYGHMGFADWETKAGAFQEVNVSIKPGA